MPWWIFRFLSEMAYPRLRAAAFLLPTLLSSAIAAAPGPFAIVNASVRQTDDGPPLARDETFRSAETVFYSFQVSGYGKSPVKKVRLSYRVEAFDPNGVPLQEPAESIFDATLHDEDKDWLPKLRVPVAVPAVAPSGLYKIKTRVTDDISHLTAEAETTFEVEGHRVPPSKELAIRDFAFHRAEADGQPLRQPAFRPGDSVFATFDIAGFRYAKENAINVYFDVVLLSAAGRQLYAQPHAAEDRSSSFYPKPWVPIDFSLNLDRTIRAGDYTVIVTAHDAIGGQTAESKYTFSVEP